MTFFNPIRRGQFPDRLVIGRLLRLPTPVFRRSHSLAQPLNLTEQLVGFLFHRFQLFCLISVFAHGVDGLDHFIRIGHDFRFEPVNVAIPFFRDNFRLDDAGSQRCDLVFCKLKILYFRFTFQVSPQFLQQQPLHFAKGDHPAGIFAVLIAGLIGVFLDEGSGFGKSNLAHQRDKKTQKKSHYFYSMFHR